MKKAITLFLSIILFFGNICLGEDIGLIPLKTMTNDTVIFSKRNIYPLMLVISPKIKTIKASGKLYKKLYNKFGDQVYLIVSPQLPLFKTKSSVLSILKEQLPSRFQAQVIIDWDIDLSNRLNASTQQLPSVLLLEKDGIIRGRYQFKSVKIAYKFVKNTFGNEFIIPSEFVSSRSFLIMPDLGAFLKSANKSVKQNLRDNF